jgi:hypothetical protein
LEALRIAEEAALEKHATDLSNQVKCMETLLQYVLPKSTNPYSFFLIVDGRVACTTRGAKAKCS